MHRGERTIRAEAGGASSSRPPRKRTVIGLPAVESSRPIEIHAEPVPEAAAPAQSSRPPSGLQPFRRKRGARATVRMVIPATQEAAATEAAAQGVDGEEEAFLLTRPVPLAADDASSSGPAYHQSTGAPHASASNAVMRAAVRLLASEDEDITELRRSNPPSPDAPSDVTGVALAWNGPLTGPVLRRAARLAHRVIVVVSSGLSVIELTRVQTRLGRNKGVGYVLVNVDDAYVDAEDRVGPVEEFWQGARELESGDRARS